MSSRWKLGRKGCTVNRLPLNTPEFTLESMFALHTSEHDHTEKPMINVKLSIMLGCFNLNAMSLACMVVIVMIYVCFQITAHFSELATVLSGNCQFWLSGYATLADEEFEENSITWLPSPVFLKDDAL